MLIATCLSPFGIEKVNALRFQTDFQTIVYQLEQVEEFVGLLTKERSFPLEHYSDTRAIIHQLMEDPTSWCTVEEVLALLQTLVNGEKWYSLVTQQENHTYRYPTLALLANAYTPLDEVVNYIHQLLDKNGQVRDNASRELASIRKEKIQVAQTIQKKFDTLWRKAQASGLIDTETPASVRDGRMVIPITASFKRRFKGVIHDESRSGKTVFIEPEELVKENTRLFVLEQEERREIVRLLTEVTNHLRKEKTSLDTLYEFIGSIDFIRSKALFAQKIDGIKPIVEDKQQFNWSKAYHPILAMTLKKHGQDLRSLNLVLEGDNRILVISGANSGGKSVTLKTVALLQYMLQCGLLIPIDKEAKMGVFENLFMDIGDGQSIENNLSTYTSHLTTMKLFLTHTNSKTLLLIDEFGGGTEPELGGALAESILEQLNQRGCFGIITTHFYNLKGLAQRTNGLQNGAMLYDFKAMKPLYQLSQGHPGSSYALDVARKIGLPEEIIVNASQKIEPNYLVIERELQDLVAAKVAELQQIKEEKTQDKAEVVAEEPIGVPQPICMVTELKRDLQVGDTVKREGRGKSGTILEIRGKKATVLIEHMKFTITLDDLVLVVVL